MRYPSNPRHRTGRITAAALLVSAVAHLAVLYLMPGWKVEGAGEARVEGAAPSVASRGLRGVVVASRRPLPTDAPSLAPAVDRPGPPVEVTQAAEEAGAPAESPLSDLAADSATDLAADSAGALAARGVRGRNPLIWYGFSDQRLALGPVPLTPEEALAEALSQPKPYVSPLRQCYDSLDARAARARAAQDLSVTDRRGWRWGVSADGIHLGPVTVPLASGHEPATGATWRPPRDPCADP